jgi:tetratricopeptide (TPR) repeat protein
MNDPTLEPVLRASPRPADINPSPLDTRAAEIYHHQQGLGRPISWRAAYRKAHGWTQQQAAENYNHHHDAAGTSPWTGKRVSALENWPDNTTEGITPHVLQRWGKVLGTHPRNLLSDTEYLHPRLPAQHRPYIDHPPTTPQQREPLTAALNSQDGVLSDRKIKPAATEAPRSSEPGADTVVLRLRLDSREVAMPFSRHLLMQTGIGWLVEAFALSQHYDVLQDITERPSLAGRVAVSSPAQLQEILGHLREQWHALVKTDNLLGPRFALAGVLGQIDIVEALLPSLRDRARLEAVSLGAQYAESAAWLYEDSDNLVQARYWTGRAMEWAYEANDRRMLAWTIFRRSQQVTVTRDAARVIGLAQAARRDEEQLATPTRAAIRVQEAYGFALDGDERTSQRLIDDAHAWAGSDTVGDAHEGHGSYCTPSYIEIQRANCWLATGKPKKAITLYEDGLRRLPPVYQRNHAAALSWLAAAYMADGQLEQAASTAHAALPAARSSGSRRTVADIKGIGTKLAQHRSLPGVAALLDDLDIRDA